MQGWMRITTQQPLPARNVQVSNNKLGFSFFIKEGSDTPEASTALDKFWALLEGGSFADFKEHCSASARQSASTLWPESDSDNEHTKEVCVCCMDASATHGYKHGDT